MKTFSLFKFLQKVIVFTLFITIFTQCEEKEELPAIFVVTPEKCDFGDVTVTEKKSANLVIGNTGEGDLKIIAVAMSGKDKTEFTNGIKNVTIKGGNRNSYPVEFSPKTVGVKTAKITISTNVGDFTVDLTGNAAPAPKAAFNIDPKSYNFGDVSVGKDSETELKIMNVGNADLVVKKVTVEDKTAAASGASNFSVNKYQEFSLQPKGTEGIIVNFRPVEEGAKKGVVKISTNIGDFTVDLTGNATPAPKAAFSIDPKSYNFGDVSVGKDSETELKIMNIGNADLVVKKVTVEDKTAAATGASNFSVNKYQEFSLQPKGTEGIIVNFRPVEEGAKKGVVKISTNIGDFTVDLTGNATPALKAVFNIDPTSYDYGDVKVATVNSGVTKEFKVTNTGNADLIIETVQVDEGIGNAGNFLPYNYSKVTVKPKGKTGIKVDFNPRSEGAKTATLKISTNVGDFTVDLTGNGIALKAAFNIAPDTSYDFGDVNVGGNGAAKMFKITNKGEADLIIKSATIENTTPASDFYVNQAPQNASVAPNGTLDLDVRFLPHSEGAKTATLKISTNVGDFTVDLTGNGVALKAIFSIDPDTSYDFGDVNVGGNGAAKMFKITNKGEANLIVKSATIENTTPAPEFDVNQAPQNASVAPNGTLDLDVRFLPHSGGAKTATLKISTNVGDFTVDLTGNGVVLKAIFSIDPDTSYDFGDSYVGDVAGNKVVKMFKITNKGKANLIVNSVTIENQNVATAPEFDVEQAPQNISVAPNGTLDFEVYFTPYSEGAKTKTLKISTNVGDFTVELKGNGVLPTAIFNIDPNTSYNFGNVSTGGNGSMKIFKITNTGNADLIIHSATIENQNVTVAPDFDVNQAPQNASVAPNRTLDLDVRFLPQSEGAKTKTLKISTNVGDFTVELTGNGVAPKAIFNIETTNYDFGDVNVTMGSEVELKITNTGDADLVITNVSTQDVIGTTPVAMNFSANNYGEFRVSPGSKNGVIVNFNPVSEGQKTGILTITTNVGEYTVNLRGNGVKKATFDISPSGTHDFGQAIMGETEEKEFKITNSGSADLVINNIEITNASHSGEFLIEGFTAPKTISAGTPNAFSFKVKYSPTGNNFQEERSAVLKVTTNIGEFTVNLKGTVAW